METLREALQSDQPVALRRIEKVLEAENDRSEQAEAAMSALLWRRRTAGYHGILGTFLHLDCAQRIKVLAEHLELVGARKAAAAIRELRGLLPYSDDQLGSGIVDWIEANPDFVRRARKLDLEINDITPQVWTFMQNCSDELPDVTIPAKKRGLFERLFH